MLKKVSKALAAWFVVCKYLGYRQSPVRCFFEKQSWLFTETGDLSVVKNYQCLGL